MSRPAGKGKDIEQVRAEIKENLKLSIEQEHRIQQAREEIKDGKVISNEEANRQAMEWLKTSNP